MTIRTHAPLRRVGGRKAGLLGSCLALACAALPAASFAEDKADKAGDQPLALPKMTVEGTRPDANPNADPAAPYKVDKSANGKFTEPVANVPKSITVLPKELLKDMGVKNLREVARTQPGITIATGEGGNAFGDRFYIRGFDARNDIFIDGMRDPGVLSREIFDVEQIEIAKGPGSAFAGRGSTGGAINMISKAPAGVNFYSGEATFGNADLKRITLDLNQVVNEKLSVRVNGLWQDAGVPGRNLVHEERTGAAFAALLKVNDVLRLKLDYYHFDTNGLPDWGMPWDARTGQPFQGVPRDTYYGLVNRDFAKGRSEIVTAGLEWDIAGNAELESRFRWGKTSNRYVASAPEGPPTLAAGVNSWLNAPSTWRMNPNAKNRNAENSLLANQTDVTWRFDTGPFRHTLVSGVELSQETIFNRPYVVGNQSLSTELGPGVPPVAGTIQFSLLNPDNDVVPTVAVTQGPNWTESTVVTASFYVIDTIKLGEHWQVLGGARFDSYGIERRANNAQSIENDSNFVNGHVGVVYKPVPAGTIYAAYGTSSNPAGEQLDATADAYGGLTAASADLDPEQTTAYEVGVKWQLFDEHLLATLALFQTEKDNARFTGPGTGNVLASVGKVRARGVEVGLSGRITPRWEAAGGLTILDPRIVNSPTPSEVGRLLAHTPRTTFSLLSNYLITPALKIGAQAYYASKNWSGRPGASANAAPAYWRFDANMSYDVNEHVKLRLNIQNLTDATYYDAIYDSGAPFGYIAPGRQILGSIAVMF